MAVSTAASGLLRPLCSSPMLGHTHVSASLESQPLRGSRWPHLPTQLSLCARAVRPDWQIILIHRWVADRVWTCSGPFHAASGVPEVSLASTPTVSSQPHPKEHAFLQPRFFCRCYLLVLCSSCSSGLNLSNLNGALTIWLALEGPV